MPYPEKNKDAAKNVKKRASESGLSLSAYCMARGIYAAVVCNWAARRGKDYDRAIYDRLMS